MLVFNSRRRNFNGKFSDGDLLQVQMKRPERKFTKEETKFYAAELWMALSELEFGGFFFF